MEGQDEVVFCGSYKSMNCGVRFDLSGKSNSDVAASLISVNQMAEPFAYLFSEINVKMIEDLAKVSGSGLSAVISSISSRSPSVLKQALQACCPVPELLPMAESCYFSALLRNAGVNKFPLIKSGVKPEKESPGDTVMFVGKYGNWISIKKLGIEGAKDYEISGVLSGITHSAANKCFDFVPGSSAGGAIAEKITKGKRKSYNNLVDSLNLLETELKSLDSSAAAFAVFKTFDLLEFPVYSTPGLLTSAHPDIKPPKMKGRKPKG